MVFIAPLVIFLAGTTLEPKPPSEPAGDSEGGAWGIEYRHYPIVYTAKIAITVAALLLVARGYPAWKGISPWAWGVGVLGVGAWIGLAKLQVGLIDWLGRPAWLVDWGLGQRSAFNPLAEMGDRPAVAYGFLAIRFLGLAAVVPIVEEMFLRGFLMRFFAAEVWWNVPFGKYDRLGVAACTLLPVLTHPGEALAAAVWFSAVTWLLLRTRNVWDCVAAHAVTNLLLGVYVVSSGEWQLW